MRRDTLYMIQWLSFAVLWLVAAVHGLDQSILNSGGILLLLSRGTQR